MHETSRMTGQDRRQVQAERVPTNLAEEQVPRQVGDALPRRPVTRFSQHQRPPACVQIRGSALAPRDLEIAGLE